MLNRVRLLDDNAIEYIVNELTLGAYLSNSLVDLPFQEGFIYTFLPHTANRYNKYDYSESIYLKHGEAIYSKSEQLIIQVIADFLDTDETKYVFFETLWEINDPGFSNSESQYITIKSRKYDFINGDDSDKPIMKYLKGAHHYPTIILLVHFQQPYGQLLSQTSGSEDDINMIKKNVVGIIVGAYDGEGYLLWTKYEKDVENP